MGDYGGRMEESQIAEAVICVAKFACVERNCNSLFLPLEGGPPLASAHLMNHSLAAHKMFDSYRE